MMSLHTLQKRHQCFLYGYTLKNVGTYTICLYNEIQSDENLL